MIQSLPRALLQPFLKCPNASLKLRIVRSGGQEHANASHALALLRPRHEWPSRRAAEQRDELAPFHSITSSARTKIDGGTVRPSAWAVLAFTAISNFTGT